ncbi:MAG: OmpA family protein [Saprospiraceae bacterium]|nr:MAG: OmpA family protein [Saprospiraceae bacterium]
MVWGQDQPIMLTNPSFEGKPAQGGNDGRFNLPGWSNCGAPNETPPDIHPVVGGSFQVAQTPHDGNSYLGMVVRDNNTWETVSQRLESPIVAGKCYDFSIDISRSENYLSPSISDSSLIVHYSVPARLRIWGGNGLCGKVELLGETSVIHHTRWLTYPFKFTPEKTHNYIVLEAYYNTPNSNGNILLDNASPIFPVTCEVEKPQAPEKKEKILGELDRKNLKKGQTIRIEQLYFKADSASITEASYPVLQEIYEFLASNPDVVVEIGGHTNSIPSHDYCDRLSTARAKAISEYLIQEGIPKERLQYKGYGKREPVETNKTDVGRKRNQRVEIKILGFDG